jgi:hypothetical protein
MHLIPIRTMNGQTMIRIRRIIRLILSSITILMLLSSPFIVHRFAERIENKGYYLYQGHPRYILNNYGLLRVDTLLGLGISMVLAVGLLELLFCEKK